MNLEEVFEGALKASKSLTLLSQEKIDKVLCKLAEAVESQSAKIIDANAKDLARMEVTNPLYDRLLLNEQRIESIAGDIRNVASLHSPVGELLSQFERPNGMVVRKVRVSFGVVGVIYEARPNVSLDVFALCFKTGNASVLKGGSDAHNSNSAIVEIIRSVLNEEGIDEKAVTLLPAEREATAELLNAVGYVDLLIPRGSSALINYVRNNARIPVIETGAGICHTYVDKDADVEKAKNIILNAKTRRVSVCNALDCAVIHRDKLEDLASICAPLAAENVIIYADERAYSQLDGIYNGELLKHATAESFGCEFLDYKMAIKTVDSLEEAVNHITKYTSKHSEAIVTENKSTAELYTQIVDAACVYVNVSTAFTDGAQFGFGAEIGISTQKLHARGPMALPELTTYKYIIEGDGQTRSK
ncbi:MAG: glutamate-5-semialdehyde dehydrogenase [Rikenellaceae bacterium]